jgi:MFS family permease
MAVIIPFIILAEKKRKMKPVFMGAITMIIIADLGLFVANSSLIELTGFLWLFFCGFNLLEATLPSLISKTAPGDLKGTAMGVYSSSQFMGAFIGGIAGGWIYGAYSAGYVFLFCAVGGAIWLLVSAFMHSPGYLANLLVSLEGVEQAKADGFAQGLLKINGVAETTLHFEENVAYLKVDNQKLDKSRLQAFLTEWTGT